MVAALPQARAARVAGQHGAPTCRLTLTPPGRGVPASAGRKRRRFLPRDVPPHGSARWHAGRAFERPGRCARGLRGARLLRRPTLRRRDRARRRAGRRAPASARRRQCYLDVPLDRPITPANRSARPATPGCAGCNRWSAAPTTCRRGRTSYLRTEEAPEITFINRDAIERSDAAFTDRFLNENRRPLKIGITCYPSVGGSGILATSLGEQLAARGHEVHFISYEQPFRMPVGARAHLLSSGRHQRLRSLQISRLHLAVVGQDGGGQPRLPTGRSPRPLRRAARDGGDPRPLDAPAGSRAPRRDHLARHRHDSAGSRPRLRPGHPTRAGSFGRRHRRVRISRSETHRLLPLARPVEVIHNFFAPRPPLRSARRSPPRTRPARDRSADRSRLQFASLKRIDLLLADASRVSGRVNRSGLILRRRRLCALR